MAKDLLTPTKIASMEKSTAVGGGLSVFVRGGRDGSKSYGFRGTLNGKQIGMHFGSVKKMSPAQARAQRDYCNSLIRAGTDPRADKAKKKKQRSGPAPTVNKLLDLYFEKKIEPKREHDTETKRDERIKKAMRYLGQIRKAIGRVAVAEVDVEMLRTSFNNLEELSSPADELRLHLRRAFAYAVALGWRKGCDPANPASKEILKALMPNGYREQEHRPSLSYTDAPRFVAEVKARKSKALGREGNDLVTTAPLLFLVYTGVRTQEVREARWSEIDWDKLLWNVPSDHRKLGHTKNKIRAVPISAAMLEVLNEQKEKHRGTGNDGFIFPGGGYDGGIGRGVINAFIKDTLKWDVHITPHGFRTTLHTWAKAQRPPYDDFYIKAQFDHLSKWSEDDDKWLRPSVADIHYSHSAVDYTIDGKRARREMTERYGEYLTSYKSKGSPQ